MPQVSENNKRIAKNTILLYCRLFALMVVSLYTSRVVLNTLGAEDYGIYNVVGGFVAIFCILTNALSNAISRFITFSTENPDNIKKNDIFCTSINLMVIASVFFIACAEIIGTFFLNRYMQIPPSRLFAANIVLQLSIFSFAINLISIPYNAVIIAYEKMSAFAYISIFEAIAKLLSAITLTIIGFDKLISWAICLFFISVIVRMTYQIYCKKQFPECQYHFALKKRLIASIGNFTGWTLLGETAGILKNEGVNVVFNIYFGPIINAAYGIAIQVTNTINQFVLGFITAVNPQIIKTYAKKEIMTSYKLVLTSTRLSFFLLFIIAIPIIAETEFILKIWLKNIPQYSIIFVQLTIVLALIDSISYPLITLQRATGKIKYYQIVCGTIHLCNFPIAWLLLKTGSSPQAVFKAAIIIAIVNTFVRLFMTKRCVDIKIKSFLIDVILRLSIISLSTSSIIYLLKKAISSHEILLIIISIMVTFAIIITLGIKKEEKTWAIELIKEKRKFFTC